MKTAGICKGKIIVEGPLKLWLCEREIETESLLLVIGKEHKQSCTFQTKI
jgi:hypothetical protein